MREELRNIDFSIEKNGIFAHTLRSQTEMSRKF